MQTLDGRKVVYTLPESPARGVLVFLHGHMQRAYEWGFSSATCPNCTGGLPCRLTIRATHMWLLLHLLLSLQVKCQQ